MRGAARAGVVDDGLETGRRQVLVQQFDPLDTHCVIAQMGQHRPVTYELGGHMVDGTGLVVGFDVDLNAIATNRISRHDDASFGRDLERRRPAALIPIVRHRRFPDGWLVA